VDMILWRHAEAEDGHDDHARRLTPKGFRQAERMGAWLDQHLPKNARLIVSPAVRAQQTAKHLKREETTSAAIAPGADPATVLEVSGWPHGKGAVVIVGHQPALGCAAALALTGRASRWHMKKGAIWWLSARETESVARVVAVLSPDMVTRDD